ncbi:MAG: 16S rRNA (cytosine(967)-C(5))-methyltransferase RsmB [Wujia sp.]
MTQINTREVVLNILMDTETGRTFSNIALGKALRQNQFSDKTDRAFITRLAEGTIETKLTLDYIINCFSKTKINQCKPMIRCLLRMGTYQIIFMDSVPDSAACNETVKLAKKHGFGNLSGFVNGVLRTISREKDHISYPDESRDKAYALSIKYSMPLWLVNKILVDYESQGEQIIAASFADRATTIRVNMTKTTRDALRQLLEEAGIAVCDGYYDDRALLLENYDFIRKIPGYKQGLFTVQDESSMCAIRAAGIKPGDTVIDFCAAPGGKTTLAAEYTEGTGIVYSMDISEDKLELIQDNVQRLGLENVNISSHDATQPIDIIADVVIADVPCSGLGIIGRKNDIKYRLTEASINELIPLQKSILDNAAVHVRDGGILLYSTCTINPEENRENIDAFLATHREYSLVEDRLFLQGVEHCDGFYYAVLRRQVNVSDRA